MTLTADEMSAVSPETPEQERRELGLDEPAVERLGAFLGDMARRDFGSTVSAGAAVAASPRAARPPTSSRTRAVPPQRCC